MQQTNQSRNRPTIFEKAKSELINTPIKTVTPLCILIVACLTLFITCLDHHKKPHRDWIYPKANDWVSIERSDWFINPLLQIDVSDIL